MYKNRVENYRHYFEIPSLLSCERGNSAENGVGKFKTRSEFPRSQDKKSRNFKLFFCRSLPYFYTYPDK